MSDPRHEVPQSLQALPSLTAILLWLGGKDINWWAAFFGLAFILAQLGYLVWKWRRDIRRDRRDVVEHRARMSEMADDE